MSEDRVSFLRLEYTCVPMVVSGSTPHQHERQLGVPLFLYSVPLMEKAIHLLSPPYGVLGTERSLLELLTSTFYLCWFLLLVQTGVKNAWNIL